MINLLLIIIRVFRDQFYLKDGKCLFAYFGQIHPKIIIDTYGFEIFLENLVNLKVIIKKIKRAYNYQITKSQTEILHFLVNKNTKAQLLVDAIKKIDKNLIKDIKIFDVYEGENIPSDKKSIAIKVTIQSDYKTLNENDLSDISNRIIKSVEEQTDAKTKILNG